ncbi:MAG: acyl-CoA dehydrogenase, partial [Burkholderiales bacterium]|nr:acyl-CoA dehydrogenase [Burkholderiales bacterium]
KYLPHVASGESIGTLALVEGTGRVTAASIEASIVRAGEPVSLSGSKTAVADGDIADFAVVAARDASVSTSGSHGISLFLVDLQQAGVKRSPLATIDPTRSHAQLEFANASAEPLGEPGAGLSIIENIFDRAAILTAFEQLGGADRALEMARDYALERFAFGRPIGSLQAIKHMLADMYVSATLARSNCYYGAWALSTDAPELPTAAATARVSATQAYQHCSRNNIQVHGGMGFTWQFDCHLYYRRSNLLAVSLGPLSGWEDRLVERLREQRAA